MDNVLKNKVDYLTPECIVVKFFQEGILCTSGESVDVGINDWKENQQEILIWQ